MKETEETRNVLSEKKATSASAYMQRVDDLRAEQPIEYVKLPTGAVFGLRPVDIQSFMLSGYLPESLVEEAMAAWRASGLLPGDEGSEDAEAEIGAALMQKMTPEQMKNSVIMMREVVRLACAEPRLVVGASRDDELEPAKLHVDDFNYIFRWAMRKAGNSLVATKKGGIEVEALRSFRSKRKQRSRTRSHS